MLCGLVRKLIVVMEYPMCVSISPTLGLVGGWPYFAAAAAFSFSSNSYWMPDRS